MPKPWKPSRKAVEESLNKWFESNWKLWSHHTRQSLEENRDRMRRALIAAAKVDGVGR